MIHQFAINGNSLGLLLPAIQAAHELASHSSEPKPGMELSLAGDGSVLPTAEIEETVGLVFHTLKFDYSCAMIGFVPGGGQAAQGGSTPSYGWYVHILPQLEQGN
jgi:hypothetical protein